VAGGVVYVGASNGTLYAISSSCATGGSCDPRWTGRTDGSIAATPVVANGSVYAASNDGSLYKFPTSCGGGVCDPLWVGHSGGPIAQDPLVANGVVYVASTDGNLYAFSETCASSPEGCAPLFVERAGALPRTPAVSDDRIVYNVSAGGSVTAYTVDGARP
jgi:hypothetical protein